VLLLVLSSIAYSGAYTNVGTRVQVEWKLEEEKEVNEAFQEPPCNLPAQRCGNKCPCKFSIQAWANVTENQIHISWCA
jgi:hypothetical protein